MVASASDWVWTVLAPSQASSEVSMCTLSQINMESYDDDLKNFEAHGAATLPVASDQGYIEHGGASIWYETYGSGSPVILLHGGLSHSGKGIPGEHQKVGTAADAGRLFGLHRSNITRLLARYRLKGSRKPVRPPAPSRHKGRPLA